MEISKLPDTVCNKAMPYVRYARPPIVTKEEAVLSLLAIVAGVEGNDGCGIGSVIKDLGPRRGRQELKVSRQPFVEGKSERVVFGVCRRLELRDAPESCDRSRRISL